MPRGRAAFIRDNLAPQAVPGCPEIRLFTAHARSGLSRLEPGGRALLGLAMAGGIALARHVLDHPQLVRGARVLDLGAGSGLVGIAASMAGAAHVQAADVDPYARAAIRLNGALNGTPVTPLSRDLLPAPPPEADVILAGDLFYTPELATAALRFLRQARQGGIRVLLGDIGRPSLPLEGLRKCACIPVRDVGDSEKTPPRGGGVFELA